MYVILVYDVDVKRVAKALKLCRQYLHWVQNSVFEGEISAGKLKELKMRLGRILKKEEDSVLIYRFAEQRLMKKEVIGQERNPVETFL